MKEKNKKKENKKKKKATHIRNSSQPAILFFIMTLQQ